MLNMSIIIFSVSVPFASC